MKNILYVLILLFIHFHSFSQNSGFGFYNPVPNECISQENRKLIEKQIEFYQAKLLKQGKVITNNNLTTVTFDWVLRQKGVNDYSYYVISNYVDLDPSNFIKDYNCGSITYNGHQGVDFATFPFWWDKMDNNNVEVIAGADGVIIYKSDGNFDRRCQNGSNGNWNAVYIQHSDGTVAWYGHLKSGSLTNKTIGSPISKGEYLGVVGSSGNSSGPHLHFELRSSSGNTIDPYFGNCNNIPSRWNNQLSYSDSKICKLMTHSNAPNPYPNCVSNPVDVVNEKANFITGDIIYFASYYRDIVSNQISNHRIIRPNGTIWNQWTNQANNSYNSSYWWSSFILPSDTGTWKYEVDYNNQTYETFFNVNTTLPCPQNYNIINSIVGGTKKFEAIDLITSKSNITSNSNVIYDSGKYVLLNPGFDVKEGNTFTVQIDGCGNR
jgi:murein DD-endopeptidase MepM/ murein hydrolase activator NlpD